MEPLLTQITHYLFRQSWHIALLITAVAAVSYLARNRSAHVRYLLWLIVLAKCLVPPLYTVPLAVLPQRPAPEPAVATPAEAPPLSLELIEAARPQPYVSPAPSKPMVMPEPVTPTGPTITDRLAEVSLRQWLGFGWIVGASLFALVALIKAWRTNCWLRRDRRHLPENLEAKVDKFFCDLGIKTRPKVWLITGVGQPFVWGVLRGSIYLPGKFEQVNGPAGWRGVLGHELSHVMRFDAAVNFLQVIAQAAYWFHPLVWWANRRVREEREKCCDEMAIARLNTRPKDYSTAIVNTLIAEHKARQPVPSLAVAGPVKNIEDRIKTIMKSGKKFYRRPTFITIVTVLLLAAVAVPTTLALTSREKETARAKTATQAETNWGEAVEGVALRLRPGEQIIAEKKKDELRLDLRNDRSEMFPASAFYHSVWLEVDGRWYRPRESSDTVPALEIKPGGTAEPFRKFVLQAGVNKFWNGGFSGVTPPRKMTFYEKLVQMGLPLVLVCGSHTVRTAIAMSEGHYGYVYAISNPIEIKIAKTPGSIKPEVIKALIEKLEDKEPSVQVSAIEGLGDIGPEVQSVTPVLINKLSQKKDSLTWSIANALGRIGPAEIVIPALLNHKYESREALTSIGHGVCHFGADAEPYLIAAMKDDDSSARYKAIYILVEFSPMFNGTIPELIGMLKNEKAEVRLSAADVLGRMMPPKKEAIPSIVLMLEDENPKVRRAAAHALGWFGSGAKEAVPALAQALSDEDREVRGSAITALDEFSKLGLESAIHDDLIKVVPALIQALDDEHTSIVMGATITLGRIGDKRAVKRIAQLLEREFTPHERYSSNPNFINVPTAAHHALMSIMVEDFEAEKIIAVDSAEKLEEVREFWQRKLQVEGEEQNLKRLFSRPKLEQKISGIVQSGAISPEEKSGLRIAGEGTWGEAVDGLQFGLECTSGKHSLKVGESASFVLKVRNVGGEKMELEYVKPHLQDWTPNVRSASGGVCAVLPPVKIPPSVSGAYGIGGGEVQRRTLKPGEEWTLDEAAFTVRPIGWEGKIEQTTVFARAGKYKVSHTLVLPASYGGRGEEVWHGKLASGEIELEIASGADVPAKTDASAEDIETVLRLLGDYVSQRLHAASGGSADGDAWQRNRSAWEARCNALSAGEIEYLGHLANKHPEAGYRAAACEALGETKNAQAAELLVGPLGDKAPYVRHRAARALGSLRSEKHIPELLKVLKSDTDSGVRAGAAFTLGNIGSKRATKGLVEALDSDKEGQVPEAVLFALMHIMDASALPALRAELEQETNSERRRVLENVIGRTEESTWGEAVDGLRMAVEFVPEKDSYSIGEQIGVRLHIQNVSDKTITIARVTGQTDPGYWIIEDSKGVRVRGGLARWMGPRRIDRRIVKPGETAVLEIEPLWILKSGSKDRRRVWVFMDTPGVYSARYKLSLQKRQQGDWSGNIESGARKLVIGPEGLKADDRAWSQDKTEEGNPVEIKILAGETRANEADEPPWGEAVEGVQMRVRPERQTWYESETPKFLADMRNNGTAEWDLVLAQENWEVELEGVWYRVGAMFLGWSPSLLFAPGAEYEDIEFYPAEHSEWNINGKPLNFSPGWHTVRLAFYTSTTDRAYSRRLRLVSNPVVIEVLPAEADKREWGEPVGGLQCGLRADKRRWETDETPKLQAVVRNVGERPWSLPQPSEFLYLKAEGKIWRWKGAASGEPVELDPGQALQETTILLTEDWSGLEDVRLELPAGKYPVQVVMFVTEPAPAQGPTGTRPIPKHLRIESNVVVIHLVSPGEKPETAADEADAATTLEADLYEIWRRRDHDLAGAEAFGKKLLEKYTQPDEQALIYYQLALIYAQSGQISPSKTIEYARKAWWNLNDPVKKAQLFVFWGDALQLSKERREAAKVYLRGLEFCLQFGLPEEKPERPVVGRYTVDGPPEAMEEHRRTSQVRAAAWKHARFIEELIQHRQALTGQIVQLYAQEPDAFDELHELVMKYLHSEQAAEQLLAAARTYRKNHKLSIPVIAKIGPDPDPEAGLHWGQPTEGISVRLRATAATWPAGQMPKFKIDVRNDGSHILKLTPEPECWQVEVDGVRYNAAIPMLGGRAQSMSFGPEKRWYDLELSLDMASELVGENGRVGLTPGRHIIRAVLAGARSADGIMVPIGALSDPIEIEVLPLQSGGDLNLVGALKEGTARLRAATGIKKGEGKTAEPPEKIEFLGLDLTGVPCRTNPAELLDLWEERPADSGSYEGRKEAKVVFVWFRGTVHQIAAKNIFYVQHDSPASSVLHYYGPFEGDPYEVLNLEVFYKDFLPYSDILKTRPAIFAAITSSDLVYEVTGQGLLDAEKEDVLDKTVKALKERLAADGRLDEVKIEIRDGKVAATVPNSAESLAKLGVDRARYDRFDSSERVKRLGRALLVYANEHNGRYPDALEQLKGYVDDKDLQWALDRVAYPARGRTAADPPDMVLAYDKALAAAGEGTWVFFNDGNLAFAKGKRLKELGISSDVKGQLPAEPVSWGRPNNGLAIRLIVPRQESETLPRLTFERFEAVLEVKNVSDRVIKLADQNGISGRETEMSGCALGLLIDGPEPAEGAEQPLSYGSADAYWSQIRGGPSVRQVKPGEVKSFRIQLTGPVGSGGKNLLSLRGRHELRPVLLRVPDYDGLWHGAAVGEKVAVIIGTDEARSAETDKRIAELMENAQKFRTQLRYKEALGQLEMVLALDPTHKQAWELRKTLQVEMGLLRPKELPAITKSIRTRQVYQQLQRVVDLSQWGPEMPFADALEQLKNSVEPPLSIVVLWRDLEENAAIDRTTPINMEGVSGIYLGTALRLLLRSVSASGAEIDFVIKDGVIVIATKDALPNTLETRVYDIYGLVASPVGVDAG